VVAQYTGRGRQRDEGLVDQLGERYRFAAG
jgi:hypothetical protein